MTGKGISLKRINDFLRRFRFVFVIGVGRDQGAHIRNGSTRLWIERLPEYERRCAVRLPVAFSEFLYCGDIDIGKSSRLWWYTRDGGQTWKTADSFNELPDDLRMLWEGRADNAAVSLPL